MPSMPRRQPLLHDLLVTLAAPTALFTAPSGEVGAGRSAGAQGLFHADTRALSRIRLTVSGAALEPVSSGALGPGRSHLVGLARNLGDAVPDPTVRVDRARQVAPGLFTEGLTITSAATEPVTALVRIEVQSDLLALEEVKAGVTGIPMPARLLPDGRIEWSRDSTMVRVWAQDASINALATGFEWMVSLSPGAAATLQWGCEVTDTGAVVRAAPPGETWSRPTVIADDRRFTALTGQALDDARGLRMTLPDRPQDVFLAAGAPWFFTLFGRDSLWAARMLLPLGTDLALGTLRVLAGLQGTTTDLSAEQEPGKILHELRRATFEDGMGLVLPPVYYGSVDTTALWVCLLHDAWRWGLPAGDVESLLPHLDRALEWIRASARAGDGFLRYIDHSGAGLTNQGWKDSGDAVRYADGRLAAGPMALAEVQGYAYEAAQAGAALLEAFGRPGAATSWRVWAAKLAERFRTSFWVTDEQGAYPAMALDGTGAPVDAVASNMAHLLATGLLDEKETSLVVDRITAPDMADGYGLRTMSSLAGGYAPLRYHCGSIWPHDTAIAVAGLARSGNGHRAGELIEGILAASVAFNGRLPELWGGDPRHRAPAPVPYPAACRPQAWAATAAVSLLGSILGVQPDVPAGSLTVSPAQIPGLGALSVGGLRVAGHRLDIQLNADGSTSATTDAPLALATSVGAPLPSSRTSKQEPDLRSSDRRAR
jgi:glycogen debranching enzyme